MKKKKKTEKKKTVITAQPFNKVEDLQFLRDFRWEFLLWLSRSTTN